MANPTLIGTGTATITVGAGGVQSGGTIVVGVVTTSTLTAATCTDTAGNIYTSRATNVSGPVNSSAGTTLTLLEAHNVTSLSNGNTITPGNLNTASAAIAIYIPDATATPFDKSATSTATSGGSASGTTATTTQAAETLIAFTGQINEIADDSATAPTNSFTALGSVGNSDGTNLSHINGAYRVVNATGTYSTAWTLNQTDDWVGAIATFKTATVADSFPAGYPGQPQMLQQAWQN